MSLLLRGLNGIQGAGRRGCSGWSATLRPWAPQQAAPAPAPFRQVATAAGNTATATATTTTPVRVLDASSAPQALAGVDTLVFDCDGVLWRGSETIRNAPEALRAFRAAGKRLLFVTNNSSKSRAQYVDKFRGLGLDVAAEEIVSSSYCAAAYLQSLGFPGSSGKKVLLLGWRGVEQELQQAGIPYIGGEHFPLPPMDSMDAMSQLQIDPDIGAVVVGWDPHFSYSRLVYASIALRELPGPVPLVVTNTDCADHIGGGRMMPGTGGLAAALEVASGRKAVNVGKGGDWLLPFLCSRLALDPHRTAIVGDRMDTDIHLGRQGGLVTVLPLTGVTTLARLLVLPPGELPDFVVGSVANLAGME